MNSFVPFLSNFCKIGVYILLIFFCVGGNNSVSANEDLGSQLFQQSIYVEGSYVGEFVAGKKAISEEVGGLRVGESESSDLREKKLGVNVDMKQLLSPLILTSISIPVASQPILERYGGEQYSMVLVMSDNIDLMNTYVSDFFSYFGSYRYLYTHTVQGLSPNVAYIQLYNGSFSMIGQLLVLPRREDAYVFGI